MQQDGESIGNSIEHTSTELKKMSASLHAAGSEPRDAVVPTWDKQLFNRLQKCIALCDTIAASTPYSTVQAAENAVVIARSALLDRLTTLDIFKHDAKIVLLEAQKALLTIRRYQSRREYPSGNPKGKLAAQRVAICHIIALKLRNDEMLRGSFSGISRTFPRNAAMINARLYVLKRALLAGP